MAVALATFKEAVPPPYCGIHARMIKGVSARVTHAGTAHIASLSLAHHAHLWDVHESVAGLQLGLVHATALITHHERHFRREYRRSYLRCAINNLYSIEDEAVRLQALFACLSAHERSACIHAHRSYTGAVAMLVCACPARRTNP